MPKSWMIHAESGNHRQNRLMQADASLRFSRQSQMNMVRACVSIVDRQMACVVTVQLKGDSLDRT